jgi:hypothetical protein
MQNFDRLACVTGSLVEYVMYIDGSCSWYYRLPNLDPSRTETWI